MQSHLPADQSRLSALNRIRKGGLIGLLLILFCSFDGLPSLRHTSAQQQIVVSEAVLEDFTDIVTAQDLGFNDFSGNVGTINKDGLNYGQSVLASGSDGSPRLRFDWDFNVSSDTEAFTGLFFSLFGLTDTQATFDGQNVGSISFPEHNLNLDNIDAPLIEPGGIRKYNSFRLALTYQGAQELMLRFELKDTQGGGRFIRFPVSASAQQQTLTWDFRQDFNVIGSQDLDLTRAKVLTFIIERRNVADNISNPLQGALEFHRLWFVPDRDETEPVSDAELLDLLERRACQYFLDWSSRKPGSLGIPQDRSTFGDLLTTGGIGFGLPAYIIATERGWLPRGEAVSRTLSVLRLLADPASFGPETKGRIGYRGWFYHFLGADGKRKLNFDFPDTPANESLNTVEISTIDTGLALMGVLTAQSYFTGSDVQETEIRTLAQTIYDNVDWAFMLEPVSQQFYLSWKPNEQNEGAPYEIPDAEGKGHYSGTLDDPLTLDYYTDEAFIVTFLAVASTTHPVPAQVHCAWTRQRDENGLIRTYPGSLFTYQFLPAFLDTRKLSAPPCPCEGPVNWYENTRQATLAVIDYAQSNPRGFQTYGVNGWGISAAEGPDNQYRAYGALPVAINPKPEEDGIVTYYGMLSAVSMGDDLRSRASQALRQAWQRGHWHYRFALPDAFHDQISQLGSDITGGMLRQEGSWVQRALFAIDQGPMLLHLENQRSGQIWNLLAQNLIILQAENRLNDDFGARLLEGEDGSGDGQIMPRSAASKERTVWLHDGESRNFNFQLASNTCLGADIRTSNDNGTGQPLETITVRIDGTTLGQFSPADTGDGGAGWNVFTWSGMIGHLNLDAGNHVLTITVSGGDGFGVEVDVVRLFQTTCTPVTSVSAASYTGPQLAAESIVAAFGQCFAFTTLAASEIPLPTKLAGTEVRVRDSQSIERLAPLFFVSPTQVNYQLPPGTAQGETQVTVINNSGFTTTGTVQITAVCPAIFTADASGRGIPAALALRVKADGSQVYEPVAVFDPVQNKFIPIPIALGPEGEQVFLILFCTGIRGHGGLSSVAVKIGGVDAEVPYADMQGGFVGLDQVNVRVPRSLIGRGEAEVMLTVDGKIANTVTINIK